MRTICTTVYDQGPCAVATCLDIRTEAKLKATDVRSFDLPPIYTTYSLQWVFYMTFICDLIADVLIAISMTVLLLTMRGTAAFKG